MVESEIPKKAIANRLRMAREFAGLSQTQVAKQLGIHRPTISEIEAGRRNVSAEEISSFSDLYDTSVSWIIGEQNKLQDNELDRIAFAARELSKLKPEDLDQIIDLLKALRKF